MKFPQSIGGADCAQLSERWLIRPDLALKLLRMDQTFRELAGVGLRIISGYRTAEEQAELERQGRPTAADELSTHRVCPAMGADLELEVAPTTSLKVKFGHAARASGLRWGGGSRIVDGIPVDWNHVDLGPRGS